MFSVTWTQVVRTRATSQPLPGIKIVPHSLAVLSEFLSLCLEAGGGGREERIWHSVCMLIGLQVQLSR